MAEVLRAGLIGLGTVGSGVIRLLQENQTRIERRLGFGLELTRIADLDLDTDRGVSLERYAKTRDWREVVGAPDVDIVIELVGGTGVAREIVLAALRAGKGVVTANKALLARCGREIWAAAREHGTDLCFEASVGGTIPVLRALREGLCGDRIQSVHGIVNGTCNFILSEMEEGGYSYEVCLKNAQAKGYAEADPRFDVEGTDAAHKLVLLLGLGLGVEVPVDAIPTEGIESISPTDMEYARQFGFCIKLLAIAKERDGAVEARVHPTLISESSVLAQVRGALNAVEVRGAFSGPTLYSGAGAGSLPTAAAVVADVMELARGRRAGAARRVPPLGWSELLEAPVRAAGDLEAEFYLRFTARDQPGVLAAITGVLGRSGISIASLLQPERHSSQAVPIVVLTHVTKESALRQALAEIEGLTGVTARTQVIRIEREI
jgi:homoserine dehydrogenase